ITRQTSQEIVERVLSSSAGAKVLVLAPLVRGRKGEHRDIFIKAKKDGFVRARVDGEVVELEKIPELDKKRAHTIEVVVDRIVIKDDAKKRLTDSVETALEAGKGLVIVSSEVAGKYKDALFNEHFACIDCGVSFEDLAPRSFSFNSPYGACPACDGLGNKMEIDPELVIPEKSKPVIDSVEAWRRGGKGLYLYFRRLMRSLGNDYNFDVNTPFKDLPKDIKKIVLYGEDSREWGSFEGVIPNLERRFRETESEYIKTEINKYMSVQPCPVCKGTRLKPETLAVTVGGKNIFEMTNLSIKDLRSFFAHLELAESPRKIAHQILKEINARLEFLSNV
ncbi:MAG TPA: excinuclease ABC subunit UvrA, partial [Candidatus Omnitrophota bacterium]|nr:excinuclease ABC subunit UvrA [Candidatus Omnitrophota bacterium]